MVNLLWTGWVFVVFGAILIGIGGASTTIGWAKIQKRSQMQNAIRAVAHEWIINNTIIEKEAVFDTSDIESMNSHVLYPRFKSSAANEVLASGLFNSKDSKQRDFLRAIADYEATILDVNSRLAVSDNFLLTTQDTQKISSHRKSVRGSTGFVSFLQLHGKLGLFLEKHYPWSLDKGLFK